MDSLELLTSKSEEIEKEIFAIQCDNPNIKPIADGIINIEKYLNSKYKILWILKESNDVRNGKGGDWSLTKAISELNSWSEQKQTGGITFKRMIYSSYGILHDFTLWSDMPNIDKAEVFDVLKEIAYINVKKIPGGVSAKETKIKEAYIANKNLLIKQIDTYNPDIIIAGNTLQHFFGDLPIKFENKKYVDSKTNNTAYYPDSNRIYIHSWHPSVRPSKIGEMKYCNEIILAVKDWVENFKNII